jgi:hypothetical protein
MVVPLDFCSVVDAETTVFPEQSETLHVQVTRVRYLRVLGLNSRCEHILASESDWAAEEADANGAG